MSSDPRDLIPAPDSHGDIAIAGGNIAAVPTTGKVNIYRPKPSPLPQNRPIASNTTEDMDDMLGYLD